MKTTSRFAFHQMLGGALGLIVTGLVAHAETNPPAVMASDFPSGLVRVEIFEGLPDQPGWNFTNPPVSETYTEPALGFVVLPTKYSAKGIKVDRKAPFLFRASAKVILPEGNQRLL